MDWEFSIVPIYKGLKGVMMFARTNELSAIEHERHVNVLQREKRTAVKPLRNIASTRTEHR